MSGRAAAQGGIGTGRLARSASTLGCQRPRSSVASPRGRRLAFSAIAVGGDGGVLRPSAGCRIVPRAAGGSPSLLSLLVVTAVCFARRPVAGSCRVPAAGGSPSLLSLLVATAVRLRGSRLSAPRQAARPIACRCWWRRRRRGVGVPG
jgi:hypothetical protein